jgi:YidC/Oxa1 family membrane protein insertase
VEKRFITFLLIAMVTLVGYHLLMSAVFGPPPKPPVADAGDEEAIVAQEDLLAPPQDAPAQDEPPPPDVLAEDGEATQAAAADDTADPVDQQVAAQLPLRHFTLGSLDPASPYQMLVVLTNRGAAIQSVELNSPRYRELNRKHGYLGNLALSDDGSGCRVQVVGPGTPAALATAASVKPGLRGPTIRTQGDEEIVDAPGDLITRLNEIDVQSVDDFYRALEDTRPNVETKIEVLRTDDDGAARKVVFTTVPVKAPLTMLRVEPAMPSETQPPHPASFLVTLNQIGLEKTRFQEDEIKGLPSLREAIWSAQALEESAEFGPGLEFRTTLSQEDLAQLNLDGPLELVKTFRLAKVPADDKDKQRSAGYRLTMDLEIINRGQADQKIAYQIDGPTGITTEGWWYSYKTHPTKFVSAGARDIAWREDRGQHQLYTCSTVTKTAKDDEDSPDVPMTDAGAAVRMRYAGCDTQYFAAVLMPPSQDDSGQPAVTEEFEAAVARAVGPLDDKLKRTDVTFRLKSRLFTLGSGESLRRSYDLFIGPKQRDVLAKYGLGDFIVFGWFGWVSKPMLGLLHGLYWITGKFSFGLAIVLLTVMVRGCMFPFGRKMALNAQKMQELAPEMKQIADKYKNDMEKRAAAQKELFAKHKYNPLSGCMVMFIQMPIFLGLYRGLSCDIALRQAPLIPGLSWCSNLAGPDMFWYWKGIAPDFLTTPVGLLGLGPYLNILPLFTVVLFIAQQKLFTPPPQDEQQKMQHTIMKFMMVFMGFIFHKVAAGLCLYIIASTLWGLGERLLLPKANAKKAKESEVPVVAAAKHSKSGRNGASGAKKRKKNKRR